MGNLNFTNDDKDQDEKIDDIDGDNSVNGDEEKNAKANTEQNNGLYIVKCDSSENNFMKEEEEDLFAYTPQVNDYARGNYPSPERNVNKYFFNVGATAKSSNNTPKWLKILLVILLIVTVFTSGILLGVYGINGAPTGDFALLDEVSKLIAQYYYGDINWDELDLSSTASVIAALNKYNGIELKETSGSPLYGFGQVSNNFNERYIDYVNLYSSAYLNIGEAVKVDFKANSSLVTVTSDKSDKNPYTIQRGDKIIAGLPAQYAGSNEFYNLDKTAYEYYYSITQSPMIWMVFEREAKDGSKTYFKVYLSKGGYETQLSYYKNMQSITGDAKYSNVGYINLKTFSDESVLEYYSAANAFINDGKANKLILDLRGNGGGAINAMQKIAPSLLPTEHGDSRVMKLVYKDNSFKVFNGIKEKNSPNYVGAGKDDFQLVILVNSSTASAAEALSAVASCYNDVAVIMGTDTYGKGVSQSPFDVGNGEYTLWLVTAHYYVPTASGEWKNYNGVSIPVDYNYLSDELIGELTEAERYDYNRPYGDMSREVLMSRALKLLMA